MKDFTQGNPTKQLLVFTFPVLLGSIFQQFYSIADAIVVGRYISGGALAAVGSSIAIVNFINGSLLGITTGASVVISHYYGASEEQKLKQTFSTSIIFLTLVSAFFTAVGIIFTSSLLRLLSTPSHVFSLAVTYQRITLAGMILPAFFNMYASYMRALGDAKHPLYILIISSVVNIMLDFIFVAKFNLGISGVAFATILSQTIAVLLCIVCVRKSIPLLKLDKLIFSKEIFPSILKNSLPAAIQMSVTSLISLSITGLVNTFGEIASAGYSVATRLDSFALLPLESMSTTLSTFVGQNMGAGHEGRAKKGHKTAFLFMFSTAILVSSIILLFGRNVLSLFVNSSEADSSDIIKYGWEYLSVIALFYILHAFFFSFNGFFRGAGDAVIVMVLTISSLSIRAICSYFLSNHYVMGPSAIAFAIPVGWFICGTFAWIYYAKGWWRGMINRQPSR